MRRLLEHEYDMDATRNRRASLCATSNPYDVGLSEVNPFGKFHWRGLKAREGLEVDRIVARQRPWTCTSRRCPGTKKLSNDRMVSTDPPYYDNIGYADLSDFFYVWLRRH